MSTAATEDALSLAIRGFRDHLLLQGFQHGRRPGELVGTADNGVEIHVRTGYTHGSYRILVFGRYRGERQGQHFVDINRGNDLESLAQIQRSIANWNGVNWPPHEMFRRSPTGQGQGDPR